MKLLLITSEWPTPERPRDVPFLVRQVDILREQGIEVTVFNFRGRKNPFNYLKAWIKARWLLWTGHYDLIHAHWGQSALLALGSRLPLVITFHGSDLQGIVQSSGRYSFLSSILRRVSLLMYRRADEVILVSRHLARGLPERPTHIIPIGINLEMFQPRDRREARQKLGLREQGKLALFGANPARPEKRYVLAKEAVERLKGEMDVELLATIDVPYADMPWYMSACDVLLMTSAHEGSPTVVKEALACNLPVVSMDVGDVRERIEGIPGCVLVEEDSPKTVATGLHKALTFEGEFCGRPHAEALDEVQLTKDVIDVYRKAMQRRAADSKKILKNT